MVRKHKSKSKKRHSKRRAKSGDLASRALASVKKSLRKAAKNPRRKKARKHSARKTHTKKNPSRKARRAHRAKRPHRKHRRARKNPVSYRSSSDLTKCAAVVAYARHGKRRMPSSLRTGRGKFKAVRPHQSKRRKSR